MCIKKRIKCFKKTLSIILMAAMLLTNNVTGFAMAETEQPAEEIPVAAPVQEQTEPPAPTESESVPETVQEESSASLPQSDESDTEAATPLTTEEKNTEPQESIVPEQGNEQSETPIDPASEENKEETSDEEKKPEEDGEEKEKEKESEESEEDKEKEEAEEDKKKKEEEKEKSEEETSIIFYVSEQETGSSFEKEVEYVESYDVNPSAQEITASYNKEEIPVYIESIEGIEASEGIVSELEGGETFTVTYKAEAEDTSASLSCTYNILKPETEEEDEDPIRTLVFTSDLYEVTVSGPKEILQKGTELSVAEITEDGVIGIEPTRKARRAAKALAEGPEEQPEEYLQYDEYKEGAAEMLSMPADQFSYVKVLDITLTDESGYKFEPSDMIEVKIHLLDKEELDDIGPQIVHFGEETEVLDSTTEKTEQGYEVSFETASFSVYVIVDAPEVPETQELYGLDGKDFPLAIYKNGTPYYFTPNRANTTNGKNWLQYSTTDPGFLFHFELSEDGSGYYISVQDGDTTKYLTMDSNENVQFSTTDRTILSVRQISEADSTFYIYRTFGNKTYYLNLKQKGGANNGIGGSTYDDAGSYVTIRNSDDDEDEDVFGLDGKSFGIAYHNEDISGAALTATAKNNSTLTAQQVTVKPDILNNSGLLFVAEGTDIDQWTFEWVTKGKYYIKTTVNDTVKYLTLDGNSLKLTDTPDPVKSQITLTPGSGNNGGMYRFSVGTKCLSLKGGNVNNGFVSADVNAYSWLNLVEKSSLLNDDDFTVYSAQKVSIANLSEVYNGRKMIIYTRIWNPDKLKYDYYAVNYDGKLIKCVESGNSIQWYGSKINTAEWQFTEYYQEGTSIPNNYYEFQNTYSGQYIAPQLSGGQVFSDNTIGVNLIGRRYGDNYSTILAWDDPYYDYAGLAARDGQIVSVPMAQAEEFYVAVLDEPAGPDELTTVRTVNNDEFGISMKMVDFNNAVVSSRDSLQTNVLGRDTDGNGIVENHLQENGYPLTIASKTGKTQQSLSELFGSAQPANHLFLQGTYEESGYFEFDSTKNYAYLNGSDFTVYNQIASIEGTSISLEHGQFLPYNDLYIPGTQTPRPYSQMHINQTNTTNQPLPDSDPNKNAPLLAIPKNEVDYFFGMEMEASFTQTASGLDAWGHDIIFEFSGDDDMWLFVDGELVLDLGGVHSAQTGSINFKTGTVLTSRTTPTNLRNIFKANYESRHPGATTEEVNAYLDEIFEEGEAIFKDYSSHTMKIFYMERGAGASNLHMKFNLAAVKPGQVQLTKKITGTDKDDWNLVEYPYQIYYKTSEDSEYRLLTQEMTGRGYTVVYKNTNIPVRHAAHYETSDGDEYEHVYFLKPGQTAEINVPDETIAYYVVECGLKQNLYDMVSVNDEEIEGIPVDHGRADYAMEETTVEETPIATFENHINDHSLRKLTIKKVLHDETGAVISANADDTEFNFRLYLAGEFEDGLTPCNMVPYHIKDNLGRYVVRDGENNQFVSLNKTNFDALTEEEKIAATFTTSPNGAISKIQAGYSVELDDILVGTKFKVEERDYEIPDGYRLMEYRRVDGSYVAEDGQEYNIGVVRDNANPIVEVHNQRGIGITVQKKWSDEAFMETHDNIYFAAYCNGTLIPNTVRQMKEKITPDNTEREGSLYYYFPSIPNGGTIADMQVLEVRLTDPVVGSDGYVTSYSSIDPVNQNGTILLGGQEKGDVYKDAAFTYAADYQYGQPTGVVDNVRTDIVTNSRPGLKIIKTDWAGNPISGGTFTITDPNEAFVGDENYHADENGLITTAYFESGVTYKLTEEKAPNGYAIAADSLNITIDGNNQVTVTGTDSSNYIVSQATATEMASVTLKNKSYDFKIKKIRQGTDEPIPDTHFAVFKNVAGIRDYYPVTGYADLVTGSNGFIPDELANLPAGTYYLTETAPAAGYSPLDEDIAFTISDTGVITVDTEAYASWLKTTETTPGTILYTLEVPNQSAANIAVKKIIDGGFGNKTDKFRFSVSNFVYRNQSLAGTYQYKVYDDTGLLSSVEETGFVTLQELGGVATAQFRKSGTTESSGSILLGHNKRLVIMDIPRGTSFTVTEEALGNYVPTNRVLSDTGSVVYYANNAMTSEGTAQGLTITTTDNGRTVFVTGMNNNGVTIEYTNTRSGVTPTGVNTGANMMGLLIVLLMFFAVYIYFRPRYYSKEKYYARIRRKIRQQKR